MVKRQHRHWKENTNKGYSLIELIVTLLVSSIVLLAVGTFMNIAIKSYRSTNAEVTLQMEAQAALNMIEDIIVESKEMKYYPSFSYNGTSYQILVMTSQSNQEYFYYTILLDPNGHRLLLKKESSVSNSFSASDIEKINTTVETCLSDPESYLLANYVTSMVVSPSSAFAPEEAFVSTVLTLSLNGKNFTTSGNISLRNGVH